MILVIDNFDSFTYNLVQLLGELGEEVRVFRNDAITVEEAERLAPERIVISPGPCTPREAGVSVEMIRRFTGRVPILGVCLGHQAVGAAFGARIVNAPQLMHGKSSEIFHDGRTLFEGLPSVFPAVRYHSLAVSHQDLPACLEVSAWTAEGTIMGLRHREHPVEGVQFHPESVATEAGRRIIQNFLGKAPRPPLIDMKGAIACAMAGRELRAAQMRAVMEIIMSGQATGAQIGAFLTALALKGETAGEITAAAEVMREKATRVPVPKGATVVDTCGTGGDGAHTFNVSTAAALIAAGAGVTVAKHGNRSVSSRCGSADVLKELGVNTAVDAAGMGRCLERAGIGFLFAPALHSAMKHVIGPRREIGMRTIFNILGPLSNPAFAHAQVLGVYDEKLVPVLAEALRGLGLKRALVVHGSDGLDEITLTGPTRVSELRDGKITSGTIDPGELGLALCGPEELRGQDVQINARILKGILDGEERGPRRTMALLNAAAAIYVAGRAESLAEGLELAAQAVDSGAAADKLRLLSECSHG